MLRILAACVLVTTAACADDGPCGPGDSPATGLTVTTTDGPIEYGGFASGQARDCGLDSITIDGVQQGASGTIVPHLTFCVPQPSAVGDGPIELGLTDDDTVRLVDVNASQGDCALALDRTAAPPATIEFVGFCGDGLAPEGYAIVLQGTVDLVRTCPAGAESISATLGGEVAVEAL